MKQIISKIIYLGLIILFICISISNHTFAQFPSFEAKVTNEKTFSEIPSASGIVNFQESFYVIGDDSPFLFQLDSEFQLINKIEIFSTKELQDGRISKKHKPDFECITVVPWGNDDDLLVFGSGDGKEREVLIRIDIDEGKEKIESYSLKRFYKHLIKKSNGSEEINIEGAAYWDEHLILLSRTDNTLFKLDLGDFKKYMRDNDKDKPKVEAIQYTLPSINGIPARFSGATVIPEEDIMFFTASVENDPNWMISDSIVGSYLGIIDLNQLENTTPVCKVITKNNKAIREKVESIYVTKKTENLINLVGVIDNDNGSSKLIEIEFKKSVE